MTRVKICGLMDEYELECALKAGADALGFVVEIERSRHRLSLDEARNLIGMVPPFTTSVAVVEPAGVDDAVRLADYLQSDALQIHGDLSPEEIEEIKRRVPQRIIVAVPPGSDRAVEVSRIADAVLVDTPVSGGLGGSGRTHDWSVTARMRSTLHAPLILAGGLRPENVMDAINVVKPYAVDVSSGVETNGRKDPVKAEEFVRRVRSCQ
ncbi:MAG: phosphoribosylanthranilate isomerase [Methanothrix sp.]|jgi:phosphoribosylanthranilate isomerase|uniref:N-(5'-phosphoribosyl)anthranilate isomerase n=1 Tax=Methanothrix thermoacetophila (strain DSM 6194 / JCM 14653 / NBRC 101360 / PT) TaxID=349307 RepID=TRPF_METTP|nr:MULTISPECIES: phosphoribosylanthranilate isomerase [Methanothrix]A0B9D8.1 RecName: Full=N-(5'-phosphoribosyl)anthranilate isomerase; Short=PRAI [Methanothrix thermoacetophila PT]ABK15312.1 phosphoribosylanthranilate isomerase [Methanothrix thermoacetophila PT]MBC7080271.1 phosphoribosylanthranilate isomerase [Methanothrix sp.]NPU87335.1 phosphoribosylanthranilate isomerase [Methanothrix sp.]